ncbi:MAG: SDR family NAD(P)-dependent oxidoreductase [Propionibacteriaceae bacterium]
MSARPLDGLRAVVTGGASGIGAAVVERLLAGGARVAVLDRDVTGSHPDAYAVVTDVSDDDSVVAAIAAAAEQLGGLDTVVSNAGIGAQGTVADNSDEEWHRVFDVNVLGTVRVVRAALPHLRTAAAGGGGASIVTTCSIAATVGLPQRALYSATKGALTALTRAMAADHLAEGIRVNCVHPGTADTPWVGRLLDAADDPVAERAALEARQPHHRLVSPDEIAGAVAYLVDPTSSSTTGTSIAVDGGMNDPRVRS